MKPLITEVPLNQRVTLSVTDDGEGPALLLVHGLACTSVDWLSQQAAFRKEYRVIAPDLRGHGSSSVVDGAYDATTYAADLIALLDQLSVETCVVIGHSLGGLIASVMAVEHPHRVRGVVALDPGYGPPNNVAMYQQLGSLAATPGGLAAVYEASDSSLTPPFFVDLHRRGLLTTDPRVVANSWRDCFLAADVPAFDENYLRRRACAVLAVHSKNHPGFAAWERTLWADAADPAHVALELPVGHWPHHDAPDLINQLIADWLKALH